MSHQVKPKTFRETSAAGRPACCRGDRCCCQNRSTEFRSPLSIGDTSANMHWRRCREMSCCQSFSRKRPVNLVSPAPLPVSHAHNSGAKLQLQKPLKYSFVKVQISSFEVFISRHDVYRQRWGFLVNCKSFLNLLHLHISVFGTFAGTSRMKPRHST